MAVPKHLISGSTAAEIRADAFKPPMAIPDSEPYRATCTEPAPKRILPSNIIAVRGANRPGVLVVDDDPLILLAVGSMLRKLQCEVYTASNGQVAIEAIIQRNARYRSVDDVNAGSSVQLILMDANMPVMNGYEAALQIGQLMHDGKIQPVRLVCLSAQDSLGHRDLCLKSGMEYVVEKPCSLHDLSEVLKYYNIL